MNAPSLPSAGNRPGVSTNTTWAPGIFLIPVMRFRVVCGRGDTIESFSPTRRFRSVDFPALGRPMSDTKPARPVMGAKRAPGRAVMAARPGGRATVDPAGGDALLTESGAHARASAAPRPDHDRRSRSGGTRHE